jgi:transposase
VTIAATASRRVVIAGTEERDTAAIKGEATHLPHASHALDLTRRAEPECDPALKGMRWTLLKDSCHLNAAARQALDGLIGAIPTQHTARDSVYREQLREILNREQVNVVRLMLKQWCANVAHFKVEPMKVVARLVRSHLKGLIALTQTRATNGFLEALNGLFQAAKRKARGYGRFSTIRTVIFLIAGKLDFSRINQHMASQPT